MKLDNNEEEQIRTLAAEQRQARSESKLVGRIKPHPGHRTWEFNLATGEITEAQIKNGNAYVTSAKGVNEFVTRKRVDVKPDCLYCSALNKKNAIKKFVPMYEQLVREGKINPEQIKINN